ncbi:MAG: T9SS C-terminal target domain-containing protein [Deltaproteobacteria bacterium]|nr:MAG: T9SS C-terminal target domain-containing protein [Deltaproteobacteria bacterium]
MGGWDPWVYDQPFPSDPEYEDLPFVRLMVFEQEGIGWDSARINFVVGNGNATAMCDRHGNLQFLSNGLVVAMADGRIMEGGTGFNEDTDYHPEPVYVGDIPIYPSYTRFSYQFIPDGKNDSVYYMIHSFIKVDNDSLPFNILSPFLQISKIDMSRRQGQGEVVYKNRIIEEDGEWEHPIFLLIQHGNGRDWWVVRWRPDLTAFKALLLESDSVVAHVRSSFPPRDTNTMTDAWYELGLTSLFAYASPDGMTIAKQYRMDSLWLLSFDRCTGKLAIAESIYTEHFYSPYVFSPSGRFLYGFGPRGIAQWDLEAEDIAQSKVVIDSIYMYYYLHELYLVTSEVDPIGNPVALGPDGKIYGINRFTHIVIENPDEKCPDCNACVPWRLEEDPKSCLGGYYYLFTPWAPFYRSGPLAGSPCDTLRAAPAPGQDDFDIRIYPSPTYGPLSIEITAPRLPQGLHLGIVDVLGRILYEQDLPPDMYRQQLDLSDWAAGVYHVVLWFDDQIKATKRFAIIK